MILITGTSGMIGCALAEKLLIQGGELIGIDRRKNFWSKAVAEKTLYFDLCDERDFDQIPAGVKVIVHFAANARVHESVISPNLAQENFNADFNVLEFARRKNIPRLIFASSREIYGNGSHALRSEKETSLDFMESPYSAAKFATEAMIRAYGKCFGINWTIFRFSNVYGKYDDSNRLMPNLIDKMRRNEDVEIYGANKILDFTYIEDALQALMQGLNQESSARNQEFNIAYGQGIKLVDLALKLKEKLNSASRINVQESRVGEVCAYTADLQKIHEKLGFVPQFPLDQGLNLAIEYYLQNQANCR
jgi:UDP-glucose 4-epimerase